MLIVALKLALAPSFIAATSLVARRFGSGLGGVFGGLPAIAGPILLIIALQHGADFASDAATGTLLGVVALGVFVVAFVRLGRFGWPVALVGSWTSFLLAVAVLQPVHLGAGPALAAALAALAATLRLLPRKPRLDDLAHQRRGDLLLRAATTVVPILAVTAAARLLGPHLSGLLAAFPIITPVLAAFTYAQHGPDEATRLLRGFTIGFVAYALFCFVLAVTLDRIGTADAFVLATAVALLAQLAALLITRASERTRENAVAT